MRQRFTGGQYVKITVEYIEFMTSYKLLNIIRQQCNILPILRDAQIITIKNILTLFGQSLLPLCCERVRIISIILKSADI